MSRHCINRAFTEKPFSKPSFIGQRKATIQSFFLFFFRALTLYLHAHSNLDAHTSQLFTEFISKSGFYPKSFRGVTTDALPHIEGIVQCNIFIYDFDIKEGDYVGELTNKIIGKVDKIVNF